MKRIIVVAALAAGAMACGDEDWAPPEQTLEEAGMTDSDNTLVALKPPVVEGPDHWAKHYRYVEKPAGIPPGKLDGALGRNRIVSSESLGCDESGCDFENARYYWPDMTELSPDEMATFQGRLRAAGAADDDFGPNDYWGASDDAADFETEKALAACTGLPDQCNTCFVPECWGGGSSPGGIASSVSGCTGSTIQFGGPGCDRPDNANVRISWWGGETGTCIDTVFSSFPPLSYSVDYLNARDTRLPPPFELVRTGCNPSTLLPYGWKLTDSGIAPGEPSVDGTLVDVLFQFAELHGDTPGIENVCPSAVSRQPGHNANDRRVGGCALKFFELGPAGTPLIRQWNNGAQNQNYWTRRGTLVSIDPDRIIWGANRPASELDRGGTTVAQRIDFFGIHLASHEIGHAVGLEHAYNGENASNHWRNHAHGGKQVNPNVIPFSVMVRVVPAAPYTLAGWSSGLHANLVDTDDSNNGGGNREGWRMSNHFRQVRNGDVVYPTNSFAPPLTAANNEK